MKALTTGTTHLVGLVESDGTIAYLSPSVTYLLGYEPERLLGSNVLSLVHPDDQGMAISMLAASVVATEKSDRRWDDSDTSGDYRVKHADGRFVPFEVLRNNFLGDPEISGVLVVARPVVIRRALDDALSALAHDVEGTSALHKLAQYLDARIPGTMSAFVLADPPDEWVTDRVPTALLAATGPWHAIMGSGESTFFADIDRAGDPFEPSLRAEAAGLGVVACWCVPLPVKALKIYSPGSAPGLDTSVVGCLVVWSAIDGEPVAGHLGVLERVAGLAEIALRRRAATRELVQLVDYDQVTGVLSRTGFERLAERAGAQPAMLVMVDLDDFKLINDRHGHPTGDEVLRITARRIESRLRSGDVLGRLGGDEFVLRIAGTDLGVAAAVADRVIAALDDPLVDDRIPVSVRASLGIAPWDPSADYAELLSRADAAMYAAKRAGKGRWQIWGNGTRR